jgi:hypothetical protein
MRSDLSPSGARYTVRRRVPLGRGVSESGH